MWCWHVDRRGSFPRRNIATSLEHSARVLWESKKGPSVHQLNGEGMGSWGRIGDNLDPEPSDVGQALID